MITLNYRDARPIYEQVRDGLRRLIVSGAIADGEKLPSVRALASQLAINPNTIQRAYSELDRDPARNAARAAYARHELCRAGRHLPGGGREMIEIRELVKTFDGFAALDGASLTVPQGAIYGLVGPNGAGKSTLLRHLTGVYRQDSGTVSVDGADVWENVAVKQRIASIPDDWHYFMQSSIRDMMKFYRGFYPQFNMERYEKLRGVFSLDEKQLIRRLSKGMQKQAAFWIAMCCMPDYLILDEPVDGLDPVMRRQVWSLIMQDVAERGTTVLVSSHNLRELEDVCDHVGIMNKGKVLLERSLSELQENTVKMQIVFRGEGAPELPAGLNLLHESHLGRVFTIIFRGNTQQITERLAALDPVYMEAVPLTLEEIFIYELGGADYAVRDIVL